MLSSHLLDEVERTCDAVAIVDHGKVIRQGPIGELTGAAGTHSRLEDWFLSVTSRLGEDQ